MTPSEQGSPLVACLARDSAHRLVGRAGEGGWARARIATRRRKMQSRTHALQAGFSVAVAIQGRGGAAEEWLESSTDTQPPMWTCCAKRFSCARLATRERTLSKFAHPRPLKR